MIQELNDGQVSELLHSQVVGRLALVEDGRPYLVPLAYAYDQGYVYCHSLTGTKVRAMRVHPQVCFEVDDVTDIDNWRSVVAYGDFEELSGDRAARALAILTDRFVPAATAGEVAARAGIGFRRDLEVPRMKPDDGSHSGHVVVYRIRLTEWRGRALSTVAEPEPMRRETTRAESTK